MKAKNIFVCMVMVVMCLLISGCSVGTSLDGTGMAQTVTVAPNRAVSAVTDPLNGLPQMTGVNWFGFESGAYVPHGLWKRDYKSMLQQMKALGFNTIRLPWSNEMIGKRPTDALVIGADNIDGYTGKTGINIDLAGLSSLEVMDKIISYAGTLGIRIILDNHSRKADGYYNQTLWYTAECSEDKWISDWEMMIRRYKDYPNVVAVDLNNEPHGGFRGSGMKPPATWGYDAAGYANTDWKKAVVRAGKAVLAIDPGMYLVVQGVQESRDGTNGWWGSNHKDLLDSPLTELPANRIIYSVHEYGPEVNSQDWLLEPFNPAVLPAVWAERFWFIVEKNIGGLLVGEMGIKEESAANSSSISYRWFTSFLSHAGKKVHWTYWSWNPNSMDTGGILKDDWISVNPVKYSLIKPYLAGGSEEPQPAPVSFTFTKNDWGSGYTGNIKIKNMSTQPIANWTLTFRFTGNQKITDFWNSTFIQSLQNVTVRPLAWNGTIPPGGSVEIGYNARYSLPNGDPVDLKLQ